MPLTVKVKQGGTVSSLGQEIGKGGSRGCFAHSAFLVDNCNDFRHRRSPFLGKKILGNG
jgi:hypothetical protein